MFRRGGIRDRGRLLGFPRSSQLHFVRMLQLANLRLRTSGRVHDGRARWHPELVGAGFVEKRLESGFGLADDVL
jgi:hypothetical protein